MPLWAEAAPISLLRDGRRGPPSVVLVEGSSDAAAVRALSRRHAHDLDSQGVSVVAMGGYGNPPRFLDRFGPSGVDLRLAGLYDAPRSATSRADSLEPASAQNSRAPISKGWASMRATPTWRMS